MACLEFSVNHHINFFYSNKGVMMGSKKTRQIQKKRIVFVPDNLHYQSTSSFEITV